MSEKKPMSVEIRKEQAQTVKTIGERMRQARELCNLSQTAAARRLGYTNSSKLAKVEGATDTNSVPLWLIVRAAQVYEVSIDYLFGASDDWEIGARMTQERGVSAWLLKAFEQTQVGQMAALRQLNNRLTALESALGALVAAEEDVVLALARVQELNPAFEDMKAGSRLTGAIARASDAAKGAKAKMTRFHMECKLAAAENHQLSLILES